MVDVSYANALSYIYKWFVQDLMCSQCGRWMANPGKEHQSFNEDIQYLECTCVIGILASEDVMCYVHSNYPGIQFSKVHDNLRMYRFQWSHLLELYSTG